MTEEGPQEEKGAEDPRIIATKELSKAAEEIEKTYEGGRDRYDLLLYYAASTYDLGIDDDLPMKPSDALAEAEAAYFRSIGNEEEIAPYKDESLRSLLEVARLKNAMGDTEGFQSTFRKTFEAGATWFLQDEPPEWYRKGYIEEVYFSEAMEFLKDMGDTLAQTVTFAEAKNLVDELSLQMDPAKKAEVNLAIVEAYVSRQIRSGLSKDEIKSVLNEAMGSLSSIETVKDRYIKAEEKGLRLQNMMFVYENKEKPVNDVVSLAYQELAAPLAEAAKDKDGVTPPKDGFKSQTLQGLMAGYMALGDLDHAREVLLNYYTPLHRELSSGINRNWLDPEGLEYRYGRRVLDDVRKLADLFIAEKRFDDAEEILVGGKDTLKVALALFQQEEAGKHKKGLTEKAREMPGKIARRINDARKSMQIARQLPVGLFQTEGAERLLEISIEKDLPTTDLLYRLILQRSDSYAKQYQLPQAYNFLRARKIASNPEISDRDLNMLKSCTENFGLGTKDEPYVEIASMLAARGHYDEARILNWWTRGARATKILITIARHRLLESSGSEEGAARTHTKDKPMSLDDLLNSTS